MSVSTEQNTLIHALLHPSPTDDSGLEIYRRNLRASATRALSITFPTVKQLLGDALFSRASETLWFSKPPKRADWGEWGVEFPELLASLTQLSDYPYIADCARLELRFHTSERAEGKHFDRDSIFLLESHCLDKIKVAFNPAATIFCSDYPALDILNMHKTSTSDNDVDLIRDKLSRPHFRQHLLLSRRQFKTEAVEISDIEYAWLKRIYDGETLGVSLDQLGSDTFDFMTWLPRLVDNNVISCLYVDPAHD